MKRYTDATALRRALETRLKQESDDTGGDLGRLRRRVMFDRLAVRLSVFAEKLHALTRDYGDRPNTRIKDLVDLVLLIEDGLQPDKALVDVVRHVFIIRATHPCPDTIPDPPPRWWREYPEVADGLTETARDLPSALKLLRDFWSTAHDDVSGTEQ
ncbi:MAG: nucleotidyl transferase AbiEii/AbiGii toxin family protein [Pseudonocardiaceae bacterium]